LAKRAWQISHFIERFGSSDQDRVPNLRDTHPGFAVLGQPAFQGRGRQIQDASTFGHQGQ
jgi:hypothetical protein